MIKRWRVGICLRGGFWLVLIEDGVVWGFCGFAYDVGRAGFNARHKWFQDLTAEKERIYAWNVGVGVTPLDFSHNDYFRL